VNPNRPTRRYNTVSAITSPDRTGGKVYYQSGHFACYSPGGEHWILAHHYKQWKRKYILANILGTELGFKRPLAPAAITEEVIMLLLGKGLCPLPRSHKPRLRAHNNTFPPGLVIQNAISPGSGLVIDFATSPVRTGNSFFAREVWQEDFQKVSYVVRNRGRGVSGSRVLALYPNFLLDSWKSHFRW